MTRFLIIFLCATFALTLYKCNSAVLEIETIPDSFKTLNQTMQLIPSDSIDQARDQLVTGYEFDGNGKKIIKPSHDQISILDSMQNTPIESSFVYGLRQQLTILEYAKVNDVQFDDRVIQEEDLRKVIKMFEEAYVSGQLNIDNFELKALTGKDDLGNVHYTGYFTPIISVRKDKDTIYKYPIYRYPSNWEGDLPSRREIVQEGVLEGKNLEIAYGKDQLKIYTMQVQGSGIIEYKDGERQLLAFAGGNKHPYRSIGRYLIDKSYISKKSVSLDRITEFFETYPHLLDEVLNENPSFVFFSPKDSDPIGAGNIPLTPFYSIAVDRKYIPLGATLLAQIPILDESNEFSHHEWRFVLAQDVGGAIKGPGHVDLYMGIGPDAKKKASFLHHYGQIWMILPK